MAMVSMRRKVGLLLLKHHWDRRMSAVSTADPLQICVVGSGPAGFYTAEKMLKRFSDAKVDIIDRLPTPFGLVRSGVAPDHPETKLVINQFSRVASSERCSFFGNVCLGQDISLGVLRRLYHVVVLAYGAESDRQLRIPGEELPGVHSAREFVWWYNGHPDCVSLPVDLKGTDTAVILGQGNVALDVARILLRPTSELGTTDISEHALAALRESQIRRVYLVGRRGPVQAACTAKELREILGMQTVDVKIHQADLPTSPLDLDEMKKSRSHKRVYELFCKAATATSSGLVRKERELHFSFFRSPVALSPSRDGARLGGVRLEKTFLQDAGGRGQRAVGTGEFEDLECGLAFKSIGYKSLPVPDLTFDHERGIVPNERGRVLAYGEAIGNVERGLYAVGWLKRGPTGIIGTNLICAEETVESIADDHSRGLLPTNSVGFLGGLGLQRLLEEQRVQTISFKEWQNINQKEVELGTLRGKPREKIVVREEMLKIAKDVLT
ncbi:unnamed protein product [Calypogeia fissa]